MTTHRPQEPQARVFISCGQNRQSHELEVAKGVAQRLSALGFDPYVAVEEQTLRGLKENIFRQLEQSEYFIFVDFKRERLEGTSPIVHRGSLFSHQELAIASFLGTPVVAFREQGVKPDDGILRFLQVNATEFTDRQLLPNVIAAEVRRRNWNPQMRNELILEREPRQRDDTKLIGTNRVGRFFHVLVRNLNPRKTASNCYVYLEHAKRLRPADEIVVHSVEFKWAGYSLPNAHVSPGAMRPFDAFWIQHDQPTTLQFNTFSTYTGFLPKISGRGTYELRYAVVSDNFPVARKSFKLNLSSSLARTTLRASEDKGAT